MFKFSEYGKRRGRGPVLPPVYRPSGAIHAGSDTLAKVQICVPIANDTRFDHHHHDLIQSIDII
jgi:hypothetical protein